MYLLTCVTIHDIRHPLSDMSSLNGNTKFHMLAVKTGSTPPVAVKLCSLQESTRATLIHQSVYLVHLQACMLIALALCLGLLLQLLLCLLTAAAQLYCRLRRPVPPCPTSLL